MNVLLISQCSKNALKETRRILDQFAERRGERTWQTPITQQGLDTLRRLLRQTARKNTAVACHWIRGKDHSELMWIVGDMSRFNAQGAVPTNTTERDILRSQDENDWHTAEDIRLLSAMAALFHDFGKANRAFQKKLTSTKPIADALRHEWVSLRLFEAFVGDSSDREWLERLANLPEKMDEKWLARLVKDGLDKRPLSPFKNLALAPLARIIGWLIVSHHRLPTRTKPKNENPPRKELERLPEGIYDDWCGTRQDAKTEEIKDCWKFNQGLPFDSRTWQARIRRLAQRMLARPGLLTAHWLQDPYVTHLSRLVLMLADHHYSSLTEKKSRVAGDADYSLYANTNRKTGDLNQPLDEHLIGVEIHSAKIARSLPQLARHLPRIARHKGFKQRSADPHFRWQDKAYDLAVSLQARSNAQGFFGVNMASTGCGKTLANGRIMYGLADPVRGARFSIALGLRTLTLQTGEAYRERLRLGPDDLAVLVGGGAVRELFEINQQASAELAKAGSESAEALLPENSYVHFEGSLGEGPLNAWLDHTQGAKALLNAPILTCTIDHLMPATESTRGGHQIAPMLRLMTSDLVLDEPDDFDLDDLPALTRLVHWAGLLGSRVLLSSATLPPALVQGLFSAYLEGRRIFQCNRGVPGQPVNVWCAWFDEFAAEAGEHAATDSYKQVHGAFVQKRLQKLAKAEVRRRALIKPLDVPASGRDEAVIHAGFAQHLHEYAHELHHQHHSIDPHSGKHVSFGLVRMANIDPLIDVACTLLSLGAREEHRIHLCCYHARHPLLVRSAIESRLDRLLNRKQKNKVFEDLELRAVLDGHSEKDQIFVVLATPVAEVGRDHDYDWGIVEPSSMRSIIQLAGRIRRHRAEPCTMPNLYLLDTNIKSLKGRVRQPCYCRPGFESQGFLLKSHQLSDLLTPEQLAVIDAAPRITVREDFHPRDNLVDLEHERLYALMIGDAEERVASVDRWWTTRAVLSGELQRTTPFRYDPQGQIRYGFLLDEDTLQVEFKRFERDGCLTRMGHLLHRLEPKRGQGINLWGQPVYLNLLETLADALNMDLGDCVRRFGILELPAVGVDHGWYYHEALGFRRYL